MFNKSKNKEVSQQQQTSSGTATTTPNTPDWLAQPWQQYTAGVSGLQNSGQPLIAGAQPLQQQAFSAASKLTGGEDFTGPQVNNGGGDGYSGGKATGTGGASNFDLASALGLNAGLSGPNLAGDASLASAGSAAAQGFDAAELQKRMSPYTSDVVDTSLADYDVGAGRQQAAARLQGSKNGGLYNSNNAIRDAILSGEVSRGRGALSAGIRDQGFGRASDILAADNDRSLSASIANAQMQTQVAMANAASQNQNGMFNAGQQDSALARQLQAAGLLGNIGTAQGADTRANIGLQADLGSQQRDIANSQSPAATQALIAQLLGQVPMDAFVGRTNTTQGTGTSNGVSTGSSSQMGGNVSDIAAIMAMFSDERLKEAIETEGYDAKGRRWVSWNYLWDKATRHFGVIAQEVLGTDPQAVHVHPSGYLMVNYGALNA